MSIQSGVGISVTASDNGRLSSTDRKTELITQITPTVRAGWRAGRSSGSLDYSLTGARYTAQGGSSDIRHTLQATANAELVDNRVFVESRASMSRQTISAFGPQETGSGQSSSNATQVGSLEITPRMRGRIAGAVSYDLLYSRQTARAKETQQGDTDTSLLNGRLQGGAGLYGWALDASRQTNQFRGARRTENDRAYLTLNVVPDPEYRFAVRAGREADNIRSLDRTWTSTYGASATWLPTPRTSASADVDHRYYGDSHTYSLVHRMSRSFVRYSDTRGAFTGAAVTAVSQYDIYFAQLAAVIPNPQDRDTFIRAVLGTSPDTAARGGFLTTSLTLTRRRELGFGYSGLRSSFTAQAFTSGSQRLDTTAVGLPDDLSRAESVRQMGYTLSASHRLTPDASLGIATSRLKTLATEIQPGVDVRSVDVNWAARFGRYLGVSLGGRHSESDGATSSYTANALTATLSLRF